MVKKINSKSIFNLFILLNFIILCCDADNKILLYFSIFGLIFSVALNGHINKKVFFIDCNVWNFMFLLFSIFSIIWSICINDSISMIMYFFRRMIIIFAISVNLQSVNDLKKILHYYLYANFFMMLKISYYMFIGYSGVRMWDIICGNYFNTVAQFLAIGIAIAYYFFSKSINKKFKLFYILFIAFAFYHIYITGSRKGFIMPFAEILIFKVIDGGLDVKKILKNIFIFIIVALIIYIFLSKNKEMLYRIRIIINMLFSGSTGDESTLLRKSYIELSKKMFYNNPIIGNGINTFASTLQYYTGAYKYSHNNFMEILSGTGIIGFVLYYWFYIKTIINLFRTRVNNPFGILGLSIILTILIFEYGIVTYSIYIYPIILSLFSISCNLKDQIMEVE